MKMLRSDQGLLPSRKKLVDDLLDPCYDEIKEM